MPKNSSTVVLRRWQAMESDLAVGLLFVDSFARRHKVDPKTVRRDIKAFGQLGQRIVKRYDQEAGYYWVYAKGVEPLFVSTKKGG